MRFVVIGKHSINFDAGRLPLLSDRTEMMSPTRLEVSNQIESFCEEQKQETKWSHDIRVK